MMSATEFEFLSESEVELEEEEAAELEPLMPRRGAVRQPFGKKEITQAPGCPRPSWQTVSGFTRHNPNVSSLPTAERKKIQATAGLILRSFQPGCQPIITVGLVGHADKDPLGPRIEKPISEQRALAVQRELEKFINNPSIVSRITWPKAGAGANSLIVPDPKTEPERRRNRRVEIFLGPIPLDGVISTVTVNERGASIRVVVQAPSEPGEFNFDLYRDQQTPPPSLLPRVEWMRRGAFLALAQRAFTNGHRVKLIVANDLVQSIEIFKA